MSGRVKGRAAVRSCWQKLRPEEVRIFASLGAILRHKRRKKRYFLPQVARVRVIYVRRGGFGNFELPPLDVTLSGKTLRF